MKAELTQSLERILEYIDAVEKSYQALRNEQDRLREILEKIYKHNLELVERVKQYEQERCEC